MKQSRAGQLKTILYLDHTAKMGGGEIALLGLVGALDRTRYRPVVVLGEDGPLVPKLREAGIETRVEALDPSVRETRKDSLGLGSVLRVGQIGRLFSYARRLARLAQDMDADLIHTNSLKSDLYGGIAGRLAGIPVLWHVRDNIAAPYLPGGVAAGFRVLARALPRLVVANSESTRRTLVGAAGDGWVRVVHDGCDVRAFGAPPPASPGPDAVRPTVALVGRIAGWKGQHIFLRAAAALQSPFPQARFQIIGAPLFGEHDYERSLHELASELGIEGRVEFLGFRDDVPALLARADIVVHASTIGEPFGQVVIEAMAAGRPVVATDGGALPEIVVPGETGLLVPCDDAPAMAEAVAALLSDPRRAAALGEAGRQRVRARFTIAHTARRMEEVYETLPARRGAARREKTPARSLFPEFRL